MVSYPFRPTYSPSSPSSSRSDHGRKSSSPKALPTSGVDYWLESCRAHGISREVGVCALKSNVRKTLVTYQRHWRKFSTWYNKWACDYSGITVNKIGQFLLFLFNSKNSEGNDYSSEALNNIRSGTAYFVKLDFPNLGYEEPTTRMFRCFHKVRPCFAKYTVTWDVGQVLRFLATWHPPDTYH